MAAGAARDRSKSGPRGSRIWPRGRKLPERGPANRSLRQQETETFIAGGAQVYQEALDRGLVDRMYLTIVHGRVEADTYFPEYEEIDWTTVSNETHLPDDRNSYRMTFCFLERS